MAAKSRLKGPGLEGAGFDLVERVSKTIARHEMLAPEGPNQVVIGVSGGPDSLCLMDVLERLAATYDLSLAVAHVDHRLQPGSAEMASSLATRAAAAGHDVHVAHAPDLDGPNLQARARDFRYEFFGIVAERVGAERIATGHTLDDRAETTLARLLHGAGTEGLAGLAPVEGPRVRPLIDIRRWETRAYCDERSIEFFEDPANEDDRFERAAIRHRLITAIDERWGDGAVRAIAASSDRLLEDARFLDGLAETLYPQLATSSETGVAFERGELGRVPRPLRRRLLERAVGRVRDRSGGIEAALDALDEGRSKVRFAVPQGDEIAIEAERVTVSRMRR